MELEPILKNAVGLARIAVGVWTSTFVAFAMAGVVLGGASCYWLRDYPFYGALAAVIAVAEGIALGVMLANKRAIVLSLAHGLGSMRLGQAAVRTIFERLLGVSDEKEPGRIARVAARIPLAQAQQRLVATVNALVHEPAQGSTMTGWLRRKLRSALLNLVQKYTLARFRDQDASEPGVDLVKVKEELEETIDKHLVARLKAGMNLWIWLAAIGLPAAVFGQTYMIMALLK